MLVATAQEVFTVAVQTPFHFGAKTYAIPPTLL